MRNASFPWTDAAVRRALGLEDVGESTDLSFTGISTDTRTLAPGDLFVALEGPRFDGHTFLAQAERRGARAAVVSPGHEEHHSLPTYTVPDTLVALGHLARFRRRHLSGTVVAITGSSGKTTVKELLRAILEVRHRVHATPENLNNRVGVPLTLLDVQDDAEFIVVELGTNERGEIGTLTRIAEPDFALVITVSESHLSGLGDLDGVMTEKLDLLAHLRPGAQALVGDTPPELPERSRTLHEGVRVAGFTDRADPDLRGRPGDPDASGRVPFRFQDSTVRPGIPGRHGAFDTLLALAVVRLLGLALEEAVTAVEAASPGKLRGEARRIGAATLILDCYNANPQSVMAALELLESLPTRGPRVAVLGSMLELGDRSEILHREILERAVRSGLDLVLAMGDFAMAARTLEAGDTKKGDSGPELLVADDMEEGRALLAPRLTGRETVLLKGSRGVALERMVPFFEEAFGQDPGAGGSPGTGRSRPEGDKGGGTPPEGRER